jgi:hypothetical protein
MNKQLMGKGGEVVPLSAEAMERKGAILAAAERALGRRILRRRALRTSAVVSAAVALAVGIVQLQGSGGTPAPGGAGTIIAERGEESSNGAADDAALEREVPEAPVRRIRIAIVQDDSTVLERLRADDRARLSLAIDDETLLDLLHAAGRREGLIRVGGRVMLSSEVRAMAEAREESPERG